MGGVVVPAARQKDDPLTTVMKGLAIARDIYGIKTAMDDREAAQAKGAQAEADAKRAKDDAARGVITPDQRRELLGKGWTITPPETAGSEKAFIRTPEGQEQLIGLRPPQRAEQKTDPIAERRMALEEKKFAFEKQLAAQRAAQAGKTADGGPVPEATYEQRLASLNAEERKRLDSASMGLNAVQDMQKSMAKGDWTFSPVGDNSYTIARREFEEALGRMQSGGAISRDEENRFKSMAPTPLDSESVQKEKLERLQVEMASRVTNLGFSPAEVMERRASIAENVPKQARRAGSGEAQASGGAAPGSVVEVAGKRYRVGSDGDTLTEIK